MSFGVGKTMVAPRAEEREWKVLNLIRNPTGGFPSQNLH